MTDREKVIRGLECCGRWTETDLWDEVHCSECPYNSTDIGCGHRLTADVLALLREQEKQIAQLEYNLAVTQNNLNYYVNGND